MSETRWSSRLDFILATTGAAVGLGSIWKFPYMVGENGGAAFVLVVLLATLLIGIPVMMAEILLGRLGRANPIATLRKLAKQYRRTSRWQWLGWWGALALILVLSFYSVISGWSLAYLFKSLTLHWPDYTPEEISMLWQGFLSNPWELLLWHTIFMILTLWVVAKGVKKGLELASKIMMPGLFVVMGILVVYSLSMGDPQQAFDFLFQPDFSKLTPAVVISALGQAAFSLAIGAGCMLVYGCYVPDGTKIALNVFVIAGLILLTSLLSGVAIFPLVFEYHLAPEGGPGLMFKVLPIIFSQMPWGSFFSSLFFLMLLFAAWTSSISMAEPLVVILVEEFKLARRQAIAWVGSTCWILGALAMLSFNVLQDFKLFGRYDLFTAMADFSTDIILPTGALGFAIFAGRSILPKQAAEALALTPFLTGLWYFLVRYIAPSGIALIFLYQLMV